MKGKHKRLAASYAPGWVRNESPQIVPLEYIHYFELMTIEAQSIQEELFPPSYLPNVIEKEGVVHDKSCCQRNYQECGPGVVSRCGELSRPVCLFPSPSVTVSPCLCMA